MVSGPDNKPEKRPAKCVLTLLILENGLGGAILDNMKPVFTVLTLLILENGLGVLFITLITT